MNKSLILTGFDPFNHSGGIEVYTLELIKLLEDYRINADILCASDFQNSYNLNNAFIGKVYNAGRSILSLTHDVYDFVILNGYYGGGYFPKRIKSYTIFHSTHSGYAEAVKKIVPRSTYLEIKYIIGDILEQSSAYDSQIIAVSEMVKSELIRYYNIQDVKVIPNPVDTDFFHQLPMRKSLREKYGVSMNQKVALFVGRWEKSKGCDVIERVMKHFKDLFWIIVSSTGGEISPPDKRNILNLSRLSHIEMREIYSLSDFMLMPSRYEGFGLAAAEAMSSGLPVIGTPVGFLRDVYLKEPFSILSVPYIQLRTSETVHHITEAIHDLFSDERRFMEISRKGREEIQHNFNKQRWLKRMRDVLCLM